MRQTRTRPRGQAQSSRPPKKRRRCLCVFQSGRSSSRTLKSKIGIGLPAGAVLGGAQRLPAKQAALDGRRNAGKRRAPLRRQTVEACNLAACKRRTDRNFQDILEIVDAAMEE